MFHSPKHLYLKNSRFKCDSSPSLTVATILACLMALAMLSGCDQMVTRSFGGTTTYNLPAGTELVSLTWKDSNLWVLYYEAATKRCVFAEQAWAGNLEGKVIIPNCNPLQLAK